MSSKIDKLTQKIYNEGIDKANEQAKKIIAEAEAKAEKIIADAKSRAEEIKTASQNESKSLKNEVIAELQVASDQVIETLKQNISELIVADTLDKTLEKSLNDKDFLKSVILSLVSNWNQNSAMIDLTLILGKDKEKEFSSSFVNSVLKELNNKVEIKFEKGFKDGFIIEPKDGNFKISFTKEDFINFFKLHLKPKVRELLFKD